MQTLPTLLQDLARRARFTYLIEILPRPTDAWAAKKMATQEVTVDGITWDAGMVRSITQLSSKVDLTEGGQADTTDSITIRLAKENRFNDLSTERIDGRQVDIYVTAIPPNRIKNGGMESYDGGMDPTDWTVTEGGTTVVGVSNNPKQEGTYSCELSTGPGGGDPDAQIEQEFTLGRGSYLHLKWWQYSKTGGSPQTMKVLIQLGSVYWNAATQSVSVIPVWNSFTNAAYQTWEQFSVDTDWSQWGITGLEEVTCRVAFKVESVVTMNVDAVQVEGEIEAAPFYYDKDHMIGDYIFKKMQGVVKGTEWDDDEFVIKVDGFQADIHREIPVTVIDPDTLGYSDIPSENIGLPFPMTYANGLWLLDGKNIFLPPTQYVQGGPRQEGELPLGRLARYRKAVWPHTSNLAEVYFDRPGFPLGSIVWATHFDGKSGLYYRDMNAPSGPAPARDWNIQASQARVQETSTPSIHLIQGRAPFTAWLRAMHVDNVVGSWINQNNVLDQDYGTQARQTTVAVNYLRCRLNQHELDQTAVIGVYFIGTAGSNSGTGTLVVKAALQSPNLLPHTTVWNTVINQVVPALFDNTPWGRIVSDPGASQWEDALAMTVDTRSHMLRGISDDMSLVIEMDTTSMGSPDVFIDEMAVRIDFTLDMMKVKWGFEGSGRTFTDTWGGRKTVTNVITEPTDVLESILRDELGEVTANIDTAAFDAINPQNLSCDGQVIEFEDSIDVIDGICRDHRLLYFMNTEGKHTVRELAHGAPVKFLTRSHFQHGSVKAKWTDFKKCANKIRLHYRMNQHTGDFKQSLYCNKDGQNIGDATYQTKCQTSFEAVGQENPLDWEAGWVWHEDTAISLVKWIVDWMALPRLILNGNLFMEHLGLEVGDIVAFYDMDDYIPQEVPSSSVFMLEKIRTSLIKGTVGVQFLEVRQP